MQQIQVLFFWNFLELKKNFFFTYGWLNLQMQNTQIWRGDYISYFYYLYYYLYLFDLIF